MRIALLFLLGLLAPPLAAAERMEMYELHHRGADEVAATLRPLLRPGEALTSSGNLLILRAGEATHEQVRALLPQIDRPLAQLRVSVRQRTRGQRNEARIGVRGDLRAGSHAPGEVEVEAHARTHATQRDQSSSLLVTEGGEAFIQVGDDLPYPVIGLTPGGVVAGVDYRAVRRGFLVRPRLQGDRVLLDISVVDERPSRRQGGAIEHGSLHTTVSGRIGEWIPLGGVEQTQSGRHTRILGTGRRQDREMSGIEIRVERQ